QAKLAEFAHCVKDRLGVPAGDPLRAAPYGRFVLLRFSAAGKDHGRGRVRNQDADRDRFGCQPAGPDLVEWFCQGTVQRFAGESGEVERDVRTVERMLYVWAEPYWPLGLCAHERAAALPGDDQPLVAEDAQRGLDRFPCHAVPLGEIVL